MREIDPGHLYSLHELDDGDGQSLMFVKRVGDEYPGNIPPAHAGTTTQDVLRVLIKRMEYVDRQEEHPRNRMTVRHLTLALYQLEARHAEKSGLQESFYRLQDGFTPISDMPVCSLCGHIVCHHSESKV